MKRSEKKEKKIRRKKKNYVERSKLWVLLSFSILNFNCTYINNFFMYINFWNIWRVCGPLDKNGYDINQTNNMRFIMRKSTSFFTCCVYHFTQIYQIVTMTVFFLLLLLCILIVCIFILLFYFRIYDKRKKKSVGGWYSS